MSQSQEEQGAVWDWDGELDAKPKPSGQRAKVRIATRVAMLTVPIIGVTLLTAGGGSSQQVFAGDRTAAAVTLQLPSGLLNTVVSLSCTDARRAAGAVSRCTVSFASQSNDPVRFDVDYTDAQGDYSFTPPGAPGGSVLKGNVLQ